MFWVPYRKYVVFLHGLISQGTMASILPSVVKYNIACFILLRFCRLDVNFKGKDRFLMNF